LSPAPEKPIFWGRRCGSTLSERTKISNIGVKSPIKSHHPRDFRGLAGAVLTMTMDRSLKVQAGAIKSRNVLTRAERITRLKELDRWDDEMSVVGMPKVRVVKVSLKKKKKVKKEETDDKKGKKKK
jgi:small basic protein (TIGR04137 family)